MENLFLKFSTLVYLPEEKQNEKITQSPSVLISYLILFICTIVFVFDIIKEPKYIFIISKLFFGLICV